MKILQNNNKRALVKIDYDNLLSQDENDVYKKV